MAKQRVMTGLALSASFFALGVIALGAFTRLMDAGLGCPDWPGCYGHWVAPMVASSKAWVEMVHRYFAGTLSALTVSIILIIVLKKQFRTRSNLFIAAGLVLLIVYQVMLGQWTVTLKLLPIIVTQHLLGGYLIVSLLWLLYLTNRTTALDRAGLTRKAKSLILLGVAPAFILLFLQIFLGAWTSTHYASLSCPDFPWCGTYEMTTARVKEALTLFSPIGINYDGGVLTDAVRQTIQMMHRIGALLLTTYFIIFTMLIMPSLKYSFTLVKMIYIILGLLCLQICLGIVNVIFKLPLVNAICHNLTAVLLLLALITFTHQLVMTPQKGAIT